jgi:hypothetical protein
MTIRLVDFSLSYEETELAEGKEKWMEQEPKQSFGN